MKRKYLIGLLFLALAVTQPMAGPFDWIPIPKFDFEDVVRVIRKAVRIVDNVVINPVVNLGKDAYTTVLGTFVNESVITAAVKAKIQARIEQNVMDVHGILMAPAGNNDHDGSLTVFTDPVTGNVLFQDNVNKVRYAYQGIESADLPAMGKYDGSETLRPLVEPRGITTDYQGNFWVTDARSGNIHRIQYDYLARVFHSLGVLGGFDSPYAVSFTPGATDIPDDDLLYLVERSTGLLCRIDPWFSGERDLNEVIEYSCAPNPGGAAVHTPMAVAVENNSQGGAVGSVSVLYVAHDGNKISKLEDTGTGFLLLGTSTVGTSGTTITGLATDAQGFLYAVDKVNSRVLYLNSSGNTLVENFAFGQQGTGSELNSVKFNAPKTIALFGNTVIVSEAWTNQSGIQRFRAVPTLDRNNASVFLKPDDPSVMNWKLTLSQSAQVQLSLAYFSNPANLANGVTVFTHSANLPPAGTILSFPFTGNANGFNGIPLFVNGLYRFTMTVSSPQDQASPTDVFSQDVILSTPTSRPNLSLRMKELTAANMSKPEIVLQNLSSQSLQDFTIRFWMSREEFSSNSIVIDKYFTNPDGVLATVGYHPLNSKIVYADFKYPQGYVLAPGQSTADAGFQYGLHFLNYGPGQWNRENDYSWEGIGSAYSVTSNVTVFSSQGRILYGTWPDIQPPPLPPPPAQSGNPVLGFETIDSWTSSLGTLNLNTSLRTEGNASLSLNATGWFTVSGSAMATVDIVNETSRMSLDVYVPEGQPNPWWLGSVEMFVKCPSAGITNAYLGHYELTTLPRGVFNTLSFNLPSSVLSTLQGNFTDFSIRFAVNLPAAAPPILIDYLRFTTPLPSTPPILSGHIAEADGSLIRDASVSVTGNQSTTVFVDQNGNFSIPGLPAGGNYTITAFKQGYGFTPASQFIGNFQTSTAVNFIGSLPTPWRTQDIGSVGLAGGVSKDGATFEVSGSGADIWGNADAFRYVFKPLSGDLDIKAKVGSVENVNGGAKAGIMIRENMEPDSKNASLFVTPSNGLIFQGRLSAGGTSVSTGLGGAAPKWLRLTTVGGTVNSFWSDNGTSWNLIGSGSLPMSTLVYGGLAVTSHNNAVLCKSLFESVSVQTLWTTADVGSVGIPGSGVVSASTASVSGSGADIWGNADAFTFVYRPLYGDGSLIARISSIGNTSPGAKVGIMIRESLNPDSKNAAMLGSLANGLAIQVRSTAGGVTSSSLTGGAGSWLKVTRTGNTLTAYRSENGNVWVTLGSAPLAMAQNILLGLAVTSRNNAVVNTSTFDNVQFSE